MSVSEHQMDDTDLSVSLDVGDCHQELSLRRGTLGDVIDITTLYAKTGRFTYDPSFTVTASCELQITFIDGDKGICFIAAFPSRFEADNGDDAWRYRSYFPLKIRRPSIFQRGGRRS